MLELGATITTVGSVLLANLRSTKQYPIGILGTILFFFVFWNAGLYSSAALQVIFTAVQLYGWWYWLKGGENYTRPKITHIKYFNLVNLGILTVLCSLILGTVVSDIFGAQMASLDAQIFGFSILAQFLLDRKKIESWVIWALVNVVSVYVYFSMGLTMTAILYIGLLLNTVIGYHMWNKELKSYA